MPTEDGDRKATQESTLLDVLVGHCGEELSRELIEELVDELMTEITKGPTAWAFAKGG